MEEMLNRFAWFVLFAAAWFALLPRAADGIICLVFALAVIAPMWWLCSVALSRSGLGNELSVVAGGALCWIGLWFTFHLREALAVAERLFDGAIVGLLALLVLFTWRRFAADRVRLRFVDRADLPWVLLVIPVLFAFPRLGNEVRLGSEVGYYGLFFVDFGNLRSMVNMVMVSPNLPQRFVDGTGPLAYHWLFFSVPAWMGSFFGFRVESGGTLTICNFVGAVFFFKGLSRACAVALQSAGRSASQWCPWGAGLGIVALSTSYFYLAAVNVVNVPWFTQGVRNHLLLQLPNSVNVFGNNTFALTLVLITLLALLEWNETGRPALLIAAAVATAWIPGFSITLVPGLALGIGVACLLGLVRSRWLVLAAFATVGSLMLVVFWSLHLFNGRSESLAVSFDGGQYLQNVVLSLFPAILALCWGILRTQSAMTRLITCIVAATLVVPTFLMLQNNQNEGVHFSMKTGSLIVTMCAPLFAVLAHDWWIGIRHTRAQRWALALLVAAGVANTVAYAISGPLARFTHQRPKAVIATGHFDALTHIRLTTPRTALVIDPLKLDEPYGDAAVMVAARRVVLAGGFSRIWEFRNAETDARMESWRKWEQSNFSDEQLAELFARLGDRLLLQSDLQSRYWALDARFENVRVYRSLLRKETSGSPGH